MKEYWQTISDICRNIHTGLIDFDQPRSEAPMPTQTSSEFITNKQQGDWAEDVIFTGTVCTLVRTEKTVEGHSET